MVMDFTRHAGIKVFAHNVIMWLSYFLKEPAKPGTVPNTTPPRKH